MSSLIVKPLVEERAVREGQDAKAVLQLRADADKLYKNQAWKMLAVAMLVGGIIGCIVGCLHDFGLPGTLIGIAGGTILGGGCIQAKAKWIQHRIDEITKRYNKIHFEHIVQQQKKAQDRTNISFFPRCGSSLLKFNVIN